MNLDNELHHLIKVVSHRLGGFIGVILGILLVVAAGTDLSTGAMLKGGLEGLFGVFLLGGGWWALRRGQEHREARDKAKSEEDEN
ncbi:MAG: hypothetical protein SV186_01470 [Candidatus Nanohaloarchaea archaeon]|nr:hypothetical protein [Candidatus Nanohaloarchaea archaeon]